MTLTRQQTALVVAARSQATSDNGDLFNAIWDDSPASYYNQLRADYLDLEDQIAAAIENNEPVNGMNEDGDPIQIGGMPSRPRPKQV